MIGTTCSINENLRPAASTVSQSIGARALRATALPLFSFFERIILNFAFFTTSNYS